MVHHTSGDTFSRTTHALVNPVNTVGVMGKDLALAFKKKYPHNFKCYQQACQKKALDVGQLLIIDDLTQIDETLRYTVRFQNTGNDTAFTVRIEDKISESLKPLAASHPYSVSVRDDRTVSFLFENILLPDSTTNLPGSQGFVTFEIDAHPNLEDFATVDNTAGIYFDFNQPVITNTVTSTLVEFLDEDQDGFLFYEECDDEVFAINPNAEEIPNNGIDENCDDLDDFPVSTQNQLSASLRLYPNPVTDQLSLEYSATSPLSVSIFNATGSIFRNFTLRGDLQLNLADLPVGLYLIHFQDVASGETTTARIVKQ